MLADYWMEVSSTQVVLVLNHLYSSLEDVSRFSCERDRDCFSQQWCDVGKVIKGWDTGVATMKKGELCELVCTPEYAYGKQGSGAKIPPDSTLVFQVELLAWEVSLAIILEYSRIGM